MISFLADSPYVYIIAGMGMMMLLLTGGWVWNRTNRKRLTGRLLASFSAIISLVLLGLQPVIKQPVLPQEAILLTEGTNQDSLQTLLRPFTTGSPAMFTMDSALLESFAKQPIKWVPDASYLQRNHPQVKRLHMLGYGLSSTELQALDSIQIIPHLSNPAGGFRAVHWPGRTQAGELLQVQGTYQNSENGPVKLVLEGFGIRQDSVEIPASQTKTFELQTLLKESGRFVYSLHVYINNQLKSSEKIPVLVAKPVPLQLIILEAFPGFEVKFLKTWLSEKQYSALVRTTISKNKYRTEFINHEKVNVNALTPTLLENTDIVIADEQSLSQLSSREQAVLQKAMEEKGLGLLVLWKEPQNKQGNSILNTLKINEPPTPEEKQTPLNWLDMPAGNVALPVTEARINDAPGTRPMVQDGKGRNLVVMQMWGRGKLMASLLQSTYMWVLDGKQTVYANYWSTLLESLVTRNSPDQSWQIATTWPLVHHPVEYNVTTHASETPVGFSGTVPFYLAQDALNPLQWTGTYWPDSTGWLSVQTEGGIPFWHFIYSSADWKDLQQKDRRQATLQWVNRQHIKSALLSSSASQFVAKPVSALWFFLLFLASMAYLWIERKL